ncbi:hypothetical protein BKA69DRAFT_919918 [Paraphysoderma sedebokerense]|nr:hypothetical protein BKA69DRAFT_919918 [Paraphysoderma sedebokerense]
MAPIRKAHTKSKTKTKPNTSAPGSSVKNPQKPMPIGGATMGSTRLGVIEEEERGRTGGVDNKLVQDVCQSDSATGQDQKMDPALMLPILCMKKRSEQMIAAIELNTDKHLKSVAEGLSVWAKSMDAETTRRLNAHKRKYSDLTDHESQVLKKLKAAYERYSQTVEMTMTELEKNLNGMGKLVKECGSEISKFDQTQKQQTMELYHQCDETIQGFKAKVVHSRKVSFCSLLFRNYRISHRDTLFHGWHYD